MRSLDGGEADTDEDDPPTHITDYFIASGASAALSSDLVDPSSISSRVFGGETLALQMNVDFSNGGALGGIATAKIGSLTLCNMSDTSLNGSTVSSVLATANTLLGGGSSPYSIAAIRDLIGELNGAFSGGTPSTFAQAHLQPGACP